MDGEAGDRPEAALRLPSRVTSPSEARWFVRVLLERWGLEQGADVAGLLVSELATNSLRHARSPFEVRLWWDGSRLGIAVADEAATVPAPRPLQVEDEDGRGLHLVDELADRWGVERCPPGKFVWFELEPSPDWAARE